MNLSLFHFTLLKKKSNPHYSLSIFDIKKPVILRALGEIWQKLEIQTKYQDKSQAKRQIDKHTLKNRNLAQASHLPINKNHAIVIEKTYTGLNKKGFETFLALANNVIEKRFSNTPEDYLLANRALLYFIDYKNRTTRYKQGFYPTPAPPQKPLTKYNTTRNPENWVRQGKTLTSIVRNVLKYWETQKFYQTVNDSTANQQNIIGWLLFSGIIFGGINDKAMLQAWLKAVVMGELQAFIDFRVLINIRYFNKYYGNERLETGKIYNAQQPCVDLVSQLWLYCVRQISVSERLKILGSDLENLLQQTLLPILPADLTAYVRLNFLLKNANYYWEVLEQAYISQTFLGVLKGDEKTAGLLQSQFENLFSKDFKLKSQPYDLTTLVQTTVKDSARKTIIKPQALALRTEIRHADLISEIKAIFRKAYNKNRLSNPSQILTKQARNQLYIEDLNELLTEFPHISEQILIEWIISFLSANNPILTESIEKYLSAIGYDWLWYLLDEDLLTWSEDDFEEVYEDMLDFKKIELGNTNISYPAGRLQQLHDFAHKKFGIVNVDIPEAKTERKVRTEWVSPALYQALLQQIKQSVEPLEADMLMLLFILAMRTGLRKMELLGLRYSDIESLASGNLCIFVRPNKHRRLKTQASVRRVPLYALLTKAELVFVVDYLISNRSSQGKALIFTTLDGEVLNKNLPNALLTRILQDIDPINSERTFHGFRHTMISNYSLIMNSDPQLASVLTGFNQTEILNIKSALLDINKNSFGWYIVSRMAGHLSPQRGIEYYNHFAMLSATYELTKAKIELPIITVKNITDLSSQNFIDNHLKLRQDNVNLVDMRKLLYRTTLGKKHSDSLDYLAFTQYQLADILENPLKNTQELFGRYSINQLLAVLKNLEENEAENLIARQWHISLADVELLHQRANAIKLIQTSRNISRFVPIENRLLPVTIDMAIERRMLRQFMAKASQFRQHNAQEWQWFINLMTHKFNTTYATISFKKGYENLVEFDKFLKIAQQIFGLEICMYASNEPLIESINKNCKKETIRLTEAYSRVKRRGRKRNIVLHNFSNSITTNMTFKESTSNNTINFGIKITDTQDEHFDYKFSGVLRFFTYLVLLQDDNYFAL